MKRVLLLAVMMLVARASADVPAASSGAAALPSMADVQGEVDGGKWREGLSDLTRLLTLKGEVAAPYDRVELLILRAECQLQLRQTQAAVQSLDAAAKEAHDSGRADKSDALGRARAFSVLIAHSPNMQYVPKGKAGMPAPKGINILDREARKAAYKAMFEEFYSSVEKEVDLATNVESLQAAVTAAKDLTTLVGLERAGTGDMAQSKPLVAELAKHASKLVSQQRADLMKFAYATDPTLRDYESHGGKIGYVVYHVEGQICPVKVPRKIGDMNQISQVAAQLGAASTELTVALGHVDLEPVHVETETPPTGMDVH